MYSPLAPLLAAKKRSTKVNISALKEDAEYILAPVAKQLLAAGVPKDKARRALQAAARRSLRLAAMDNGLPKTAAGRQAAVAKALVQ
jgi:hypothetical protein